MTPSAIRATGLPGLLDLLLPTRCAGCGQGRAQLCARCLDTLSAGTGAPADPVPRPDGLPPVHAAAPYIGPVRDLLIAHKERGALALAGPLGAALAAAVRSAVRHRPVGTGPLLLVPVPSAREAVRARGHDPTLRLARAAARHLRRGGLPARALPVLRQIRPVADQAGLGAADRHRNLHGALGVSLRRAARPAGLPVVLVDDLVTTGASLAEAARALTAAGCPPYAAAAVAATVLRRERPAAHPGHPAGCQPG